MLFRIWGCRGSLATPGAETLRYGGNTSCVEVGCDDGTRIDPRRRHGHPAARRAVRAQGCGADRTSCSPICTSTTSRGSASFAPLLRPGASRSTSGDRRRRCSASTSACARYLSPPLFPVQLTTCRPARVPRRAEDEPWRSAAHRLAAAMVSHQGPPSATGSRTTAVRRVPARPRALARRSTSRLDHDWISGHDLADGVDVLIHDAQYSGPSTPITSAGDTRVSRRRCPSVR